MVHKLKPGERPHLNWGTSVTSIPEIPVRDIGSVVTGGRLPWGGTWYPIREVWECGGRDTPSRFVILDTGFGLTQRVLALQLGAKTP